MKDYIKPFIEDTVLYEPAKTVYRTFRRIKLSFKNQYYNLRYSKGEFPKIDIPEKNIDSFYLNLPDSGTSRYRRMFGEWEPKVMSTLASEIDKDTVYWEFGGAWGYFSMAIAPHVKECYSFEALEERSQKVKKSIEKNGYDNVEAICGIVGKNIQLDNYPTPDIVLMDVEGFEYEILKHNSWLLENSTTFIIEVHTQEGHVHHTEEKPHLNPSGVKEILKNHAYEISQIDEGKNYHIKASPRKDED